MSCNIWCAETCKDIEIIHGALLTSYYCIKYRRTLFCSAGGIVRLPKCINDEAAIKVDEQADRDGATYEVDR